MFGEHTENSDFFASGPPTRWHRGGQKAVRARWQRQRGNDGKARILVDLEAEKAAHAPRRRPYKHPDERRTFEALEAHIATLKEAVAKAEVVGEQHSQEAERASKRVDHLVTELLEMSMRMSEQAALADRVRAEFDAYRARPCWDA